MWSWSTEANLNGFLTLSSHHVKTRVVEYICFILPILPTFSSLPLADSNDLNAIASNFYYVKNSVFLLLFSKRYTKKQRERAIVVRVLFVTRWRISFLSTLIMEDMATCSSSLYKEFFPTKANFQGLEELYSRVSDVLTGGSQAQGPTLLKMTQRAPPSHAPTCIRIAMKGISPVEHCSQALWTVWPKVFKWPRSTQQ